MPEVKTKIPALGIGFAFILTAIGARIFSWYFPWIHWEPVPGVHIHHYVYGIFILAIAGYLAMIFKGPRATSWIALLYGLGIGLTFDEFGMWLNPPFQRGTRWNAGGLEFVVFALAAAGLIPLIFRRQRQTDAPSEEPLQRFPNPSI